MSVIAKMNVLGHPRQFGNAKLVELSCVCEQELMAQYHPENEDVVFSKASPMGDAKLQGDVHLVQSDQVYLIFHKQAQCPEFEGAAAVVKARCISITSYGGTSKQVEVSSEYRHHSDPKSHPLEVDLFNLRMMIDNPLAAAFFDPGQGGYWIGIYRCRDVSMTEALALARA